MLSLHPETKRVVTITDATVSGKAFKNRVERVDDEWGKLVKLEESTS